MKKYISFFRMRFSTCVQYRASYVSGLATQLPWGLMECVAYIALHESNPGAFPMELPAVVTYIWLKEAFLVLFNLWNADNDVFAMLTDGGISYELVRPLSLYAMGFARSAGGRAATVLTRSLPIALVALLLPAPFGLSLPASAGRFGLFLLTMALGACVSVALCMLVYLISFFTVSPDGLRRVMMGAGDLLSGNLIPLPFIPQPWRGIFELLPMGAMQNVPFRVYSGDLAGAAMWRAVGLQVFWLAVLVTLGHAVSVLAQRRVVVQGG